MATPEAAEGGKDAEELALTLEQLKAYNGEGSEDRLLLSFNGSIYDVTSGEKNYGIDGPYHVFCGHEITKCLALFSTEESDLDDLSFTARDSEEEESLANWAGRLSEKYPRVGRLIGAKAPKTTTTPNSTMATDSPKKSSGSDTTSKADELSGLARPLLKVSEEERKKAEDKGVCPMTGKPGTCPLTGLVGKPKKKSILVVDKPGDTDYLDLFYKLCPLHWTSQEIKLMAIVAGVAWTSGIVVGWTLRGLWSA